MAGNDPDPSKQETLSGSGGAAVKATVRTMTRADLDPVGAILCTAFNNGSERHGYAPRIKNAQEGTAWAWSIFRHAPHEILIAEVSDQVAGICCLHPRGDQGGIGPVAVDPAYQGKGVGRQLMDALIRKAGALQSMRLFQESFNPVSFSLYYSHDFLPVADLLDMTAYPDARNHGVPDGSVHELGPSELEAVCSYDLPRSRYDRQADLGFYAKWGKILVYRTDAQVRGYLACLPGLSSVQCGPLVAEGEEEATCLFRHALAIYRERPCQTRVMAKDRTLTRALREMGFTLYCLNMLMVRGAWRPGQYIEAFGRFPEGV